MPSSTSIGTPFNTSISIIESNASRSDLGSGYDFRSWNFAITSVSLRSDTLKNDAITTDISPASTPEEAIEYTECMNTGCSPTIVDRVWLERQLSNAKIHKMALPLKVRGIGTSKHETDEYVTEPLYFPATNTAGDNIIACVRRELHIVEDLRINILIDNDIIESEDITLDVVKGSAYISDCQATIVISSRQRGQCIRRILHANTTTIILARTQRMVPVHLSLSQNRDFIFEYSAHSKLSLFTHLVDHEIKGILVQNESTLPVQISKNMKLSRVSEIPYDKCFSASVEFNMVKTPPSSPFNASNSSRITVIPGLTSPHPSAQNEPISGSTSREVRLDNDIRIFDQLHEVRALQALTEEFPSI